MPVPDSLMMFIQSAQLFLQNEVRIPVKDEVVKYMIVHNFEGFSAAYSRYRVSADESARRRIKDLIDHAEAQYNLALNSANNPDVPV